MNDSKGQYTYFLNPIPKRFFIISNWNFLDGVFFNVVIKKLRPLP